MRAFWTIVHILIGAGACIATATQYRYEKLTITIPSPRRVLPPPPSYVAICVVAKNVNQDDLVEWLVHHIRIGVGHVYWYGRRRGKAPVVHTHPPLSQV